MSAHNLTACLCDGGGGCSLQSRQHHSRTVLAPARDECQLDFRLRKVKERVTLDLATDGCAAKTEDKTPFNRGRNHNKVMNVIPFDRTVDIKWCACCRQATQFKGERDRKYD